MQPCKATHQKNCQWLFYPEYYPFICDWKKGVPPTGAAEIIPNEPDTVNTVGGNFSEYIILFVPYSVTASLISANTMEGKMFDVQFITHFTDTITYLDSVRIALEGGCRWIQLRMKDCSDAEVEPIAVKALNMCRTQGAVFIIDDRVELVRRLGADGVHLGKLDMPVADARRYLGKGFRIGGTANTFEDIVRHYEGGADYIGCGPFRFTTTKEKLAPVLGLEGYARLLGSMREASINLPVIGIGGVTAEDIPDLKAAGLSGIALSGSILRAQDPVAEMKRVMQLTK